MAWDVPFANTLEIHAQVSFYFYKYRTFPEDCGDMFSFSE